MLVYEILALCLTFMLFISYSFTKEQYLETFPQQRKKIIAFFSAVIETMVMFILIIFSGSRYMTGTDFARLYNAYETLSKNPFFENIGNIQVDWEFAKWFLVSFVLVFTNEPQFVFLIASIITIFCLHNAIKDKKYRHVSIMIYLLMGFYSTSFNIVWQMVAVSVLFLAMEKLQKKNYVSFILFSILAIGFHKSAIIALVIFLFLKRLKLSLKTVVLLMGSFLVLFLNMQWFLGLILRGTEYQRYIQYKTPELGLYLQAFVWTLIVLVAILLRKKLLKAEPSNNFVVWSVIIACLLMILGTTNIIFDRMAIYFKIYIIYLIPNIIGLFDPKSRLIINNLTFIFLFIWYSFYLGYNGVIPYTFFLE